MLLTELAESLKRESSHTIIGAYLAGVSENVAVIDSKTPLKVLGESFCLFDENNPIDLTKTSLVTLDNYGSAPDAGGVTSSLISQVNKKIDHRTGLLNNRRIPYEEAADNLTRYVKKLQNAAILVAKGEGALDDDLKEDFRTLLKEAKNEFIKREQEEEEQQDVVEDPMAMEGMEEQPMDDGQVEDEFSDFDDPEEEPAEEFGPENEEDTEEQPEEGEETEPANEDFDIPSGKMESAGLNTKGLVAQGEALGINNILEMSNEEIREALGKRNAKLPTAEKAKYFYKGNIINTSPIDLSRMVNQVLDVEAASVKMLGESFNLNNIVDEDVMALKHKSTVNELAMIIAARNKFGYR